MKDLPCGAIEEKLNHSRAAAARIATLKANEKRASLIVANLRFKQLF